jgi:hypothetical protein
MDGLVSARLPLLLRCNQQISQESVFSALSKPAAGSGDSHDFVCDI